MTTRPTDEPLIGIAELARRLDVPVATVYRWRRYGRGPKGFLIGRAVKFRWPEVEAWLQARREPEPVVRSIRARAEKAPHTSAQPTTPRPAGRAQKTA